MNRIINKIRISEDHYILSINITGSYIEPIPGQFYMLRCGSFSDPLLLRPFSIHSFQSGAEKDFCRADFLFKVIGTGTSVLSQMREGDHIELLGPLGNGFEVPDSIEYALLIAGGIGIAPLSYLAQYIAKKGHIKYANLIFGANKASHIVALDIFKKLNFHIVVYTEDGSMGEKGYATDSLNMALTKCKKDNSMVFACGPHKMLARIAQGCISMKIPCQVSIDRRMACGIGACLGCVIRAANVSPTVSIDKIYKRVCKDGPVFYADEILWPHREGE